MKIFSAILIELKDLCNPYCILLIIAVGLFTFFVDGYQLKHSKNYKDSRKAKIIGLIYIVGGPLIFVITKLF